MSNKRPSSFCGMLKYEAKQFCLNTALHGYRFIVLPKRILLERVFWVVIVIVSMVAALTLLCIAWVTFQESPTILVTDSTHYPIWNYPFPAVTICSFNTLSKEKTMKFAEEINDKRYDIPSEDLAVELRILFQLIYNNNSTISQKQYSRLQDILESSDYTVEGVLQRLAPNCTELLQRCKWKGEERRCDSIFELIKTTEGYCCTFNYYALKNHNFSGVLANKSPTVPRRVSACGFLTALEVVVNSDPDDYFASQIPAIGHRVEYIGAFHSKSASFEPDLILIHNSYHFPDWNAQSAFMERSIHRMIGVTPTITYSTDGIIDLAPNKRKCLFNNESSLHNFQYNFHNCMVECRMNLTRRLCGCVPFYYHSDTGTYPKSKTCNLRDIGCITQNTPYIMSSTPGRYLHELGIAECKCMPDCEYVDYALESSAGIFTRNFSSNQLNLYSGIQFKHQSVLRVYYNDLVATKNRRNVVFSWHTLLAYYGGLLGLFIGFSFVSAVELIYFFTIRLIVDIQHRNETANKKREGQFVHVKPPNYESLNPRSLAVPPEKFKLRRRSQS